MEQGSEGLCGSTVLELWSMLLVDRLVDLLLFALVGALAWVALRVFHDVVTALVM